MHLLGRIVAVIGLCSLSLGAARAQDKSSHDHLPYEEKSVWTITYMEAKPGKFNAYLEDLSKMWLAAMERLKADGYVLSYKVLRLDFVRDNEPDLAIMVEYKNMAAFDAGTRYWEKVIREIAGSLDQADKAEINREELRKIRGTVLFRELELTADSPVKKRD
jgi:hypothetical protein